MALKDEMISTATGTIVSTIMRKGLDKLCIYFPGLELKAAKNFVDICKKTSAYLTEKHIPLEQCRQIMDKLGLVFIPSASVETEPELQDLWAHYLANALDPNFEQSKLRVAYMDIIKSLDLSDVRILEYCRRQKTGEIFKADPVIDSTALGIEQYHISIENLKRLQLVTVPLAIGEAYLVGDSFIEENNSQFRLTAFCQAFFEACMS